MALLWLQWIRNFKLLILSLLQSACQLVGARCVLVAATNALQTAYDLVAMHATHELANSLQVAMTSSKECDILDDIVVVEGDIDLL